MLIVTGQSKADALMKTVEQGVNHMYTASILQMHKRAVIACDYDATSDLRVRTVRYFEGLEHIYHTLPKETVQQLPKLQPIPKYSMDRFSKL